MPPIGVSMGIAQSAEFENVIPPPPTPTVTRVSPSFGPPGGGTPIEIDGTNFLGGQPIEVGGVAPTSIVVVSPTKITAITAVGTAGYGVVTVDGVVGPAWTYIDGEIADWDADNAPNGGGTVSGSIVDTIGGQLLAPTGAPTWAAAQTNGHAAITYNGTTQDMQCATFARAQPLQIWEVIKQITWADSTYLVAGPGGSDAIAFARFGAPPAVGQYAGTGISTLNSDLVLNIWGIVQARFQVGSDQIIVNDGIPVAGNPGGNGFGGGLGHGAYVDGSGRSRIAWSRTIISDPTITDSEAMWTALARDYLGSYCTMITDGDSISRGYCFIPPATKSWPAQAGVLLGNTYQPPYVYDEAVTGDPIDGPSPFTGTTLMGLAPTTVDVELARSVGQKFVIFVEAGGSNDLAIGATAATVLARMAAINAGRRAAWALLGMPADRLKIIQCTVIARLFVDDIYGTAASKQAQWLLLNPAIIADPAALNADVYADPASELNDPMDDTKYLNPDCGGQTGVHETEFGAGLYAETVVSVVVANGWF